MILTYSKLGSSFQLLKNRLNSIVIEDESYYERAVLDFYNQVHKTHEAFELFTDDGKVDLYKKADLILSPVDVLFDKKELQKKLFTYLSEESDLSNITEKLIKKYGEIIDLVDELNLISDYQIEFNNDFSLIEVLKHLDVHLIQPGGSFIERLIEYMKVINHLMNREIFMIVNCDAYLTSEDYIYLDKFAKYEDLYVVLLNNVHKSLNVDLNEFIIDVDLCELH